MGAQECLDRTKKHLAANSTLVPAGRAVLEEAVRHLELALATPGWEEWMRHGVSIAFEASQLPDGVKAAWSDSSEQRPDLVDSHSLALLRDLNTPGRSMDEVQTEGTAARTLKWEGLEREEAQGKGKGNGTKRKRQEGDDLDLGDEIQIVAGKSPDAARAIGGNTKTAAQKPISAGTFAKIAKSPGKAKKARAGVKPSEPEDSLEARLDEAAKNAAALSATLSSDRLPTPPKADGPRPLPTSLTTSSRSTKVNYVLRAVRTAAKEDKFVIFGDVFELGHMSEALDLIDIKS